MGIHRRAAVAIALAFCVLAPISSAQQLIVGRGASFSLGSSVVDAGCHDRQIAGTRNLGTGTLAYVRDAGGTLRGGTGTLSLSRDLALSALLQAPSGTLRVAHGCGCRQTSVSGKHQFIRSSAQIDTGHALVSRAGGTQAIASALDLMGGAQQLMLRSSVPGAVSFLALASAESQVIRRINAQDVSAPNSAQFLAPNLPSYCSRLDQGYTRRPFLGPGDELITPLPGMPPAWLLFEPLSMAAAAAVQLRSAAQGTT